MAKIKVKRRKKSKHDVRTVEKTEVIPVYKRKRALAIILKESKGTIWKWISTRHDSFRNDDNTYFVLPEGAYLSDNKVLVYIYLEGISTPITHKSVEKEKVKRKYKDANGIEQTAVITVIKGLKYDSEVIDMMLNRKLADEFTRTPPSISNLLTLVLIGVCICLDIGIIGVLLG